MGGTQADPAQANGRSGECGAERVEPRTGLPLPDPYPEYLTCPYCGELEVEVWCYQTRVRCHNCGGWLAHVPPSCRGTSAICRLALELEAQEAGEAD
jgi:transcription elongation factor Elf1